MTVLALASLLVVMPVASHAAEGGGTALPMDDPREVVEQARAALAPDQTVEAEVLTNLAHALHRALPALAQRSQERTREAEAARRTVRETHPEVQELLRQREKLDRRIDALLDQAPEVARPTEEADVIKQELLDALTLRTRLLQRAAAATPAVSPEPSP